MNRTSLSAEMVSSSVENVIWKRPRPSIVGILGKFSLKHEITKMFCIFDCRRRYFFHRLPLSASVSEPQKNLKVNKLTIYSILGIELNIDPENYGILDNEDYLYAIIGEFLYKDLLVDGKIILKEFQINEILQKSNVKINKILKNQIYFNNTENLNNIELNVNHISTENFEEDSEDDDEEIFMLL